MTAFAERISRLIDFFYIRPVDRLVSRSVFRYAACGGLTLALDAWWYFAIYHWFVGENRFFDLGRFVVSPAIASLVLVFPITFFTGFWLNRHVAFRRSALRTRTQLFRYALTVVGSIILNYLCMKLLLDEAGLWPTPSKIVTSVLSALYSYVAARYFTFREGESGSVRTDSSEHRAV